MCSENIYCVTYEAPALHHALCTVQSINVLSLCNMMSQVEKTRYQPCLTGEVLTEMNKLRETGRTVNESVVYLTKASNVERALLVIGSNAESNYQSSIYVYA